MAGQKYIPNEFDFNLGRIIELTRHRHGMSQKDLARHLNITFQQIQKYEQGTNRLSARRLTQIASAFEMKAGELLDGCNHEYMHDPDITTIIDIMYTRLTPVQRRLICTLAMEIAH